MISVKQIFVILSIASFASAKRGASAREPRNEVGGRGLKKGKKGGSGGFGGYGASNGMSGNPNNFNTGTRAGGDALIEPTAKDCIPFEDAVKWVETGYEGDQQCREDSTAANPKMGPQSACCRMFEFSDTNGSHKYRYYDLNNSKKDLRCICNENTRAPSSGGAPSTGGTGAGGMITVPNGTNREGTPDDVAIDIGPAPVAPPTAPTNTFPPTGGPGANQCSAGSISAEQKAYQDSAYVDPCDKSIQCPSSQCCFSNYCVCWPISHLVPGTSECL